jgi:hypothetical protein
MTCCAGLLHFYFEPLQQWSKSSFCAPQTCYARILDSKRKFLEAASRYYELSSMRRQVGTKAISEDDLSQVRRLAHQGTSDMQAATVQHCAAKLTTYCRRAGLA